MLVEAKDIQPEIWSHIFAFLKRNPPPPYRFAKWSDLHQQDLCSMSRVSPIFHQIAIPHLYTTITTENLPLLFDHLHGGLLSLTSKITPKADRFKTTKHLRIATVGPTLRPSWSSLGILEGSTGWTVVGETFPDCSVRIQSTLGNLFKESRRVLEPLTKADSLPRMPNLDTVVIGQNNAWIWREIGLKRESFIENHADGWRRVNTQTINSLKPRIICSHDDWSLYAPQCLSPTSNEKLTTICRHYHRHDDRFDGPAVTSGISNRLYIDPQLIFNPSNSVLPSDYHASGIVEQIGEMLQTCAGTLQGNVSLKGRIPSTFVDMYGFCTPLVLAVSSAATSEGQQRNTAVGTENIAMRMAKDQLDRDLTHPALKGRVKLHKWAETPPCEACGWNVNELILAGDLNVQSRR